MFRKSFLTLALIAFLFTSVPAQNGFDYPKPKNRDETETLLYKRANWLPEEISGEFERAAVNTSDDNLPVF